LRLPSNQRYEENIETSNLAVLKKGHVDPSLI